MLTKPRTPLASSPITSRRAAKEEKEKEKEKDYKKKPKAEEQHASASARAREKRVVGRIAETVEAALHPAAGTAVSRKVYIYLYICIYM